MKTGEIIKSIYDHQLYKIGMIKQLLSLLLLFSCSALIVAGQRPTQIDKQRKLITTVDSILQNQVTNKQIPGVVIEIKSKKTQMPVQTQ